LTANYDCQGLSTFNFKCNDDDITTFLIDYLYEGTNQYSPPKKILLPIETNLVQNTNNSNIIVVNYNDKLKKANLIGNIGSVLINGKIYYLQALPVINSNNTISFSLTENITVSVGTIVYIKPLAYDNTIISIQSVVKNADNSITVIGTPQNQSTLSTVRVTAQYLNPINYQIINSLPTSTEAIQLSENVIISSIIVNDEILLNNSRNFTITFYRNNCGWSSYDYKVFNDGEEGEWRTENVSGSNDTVFNINFPNEKLADKDNICFRFNTASTTGNEYCISIPKVTDSGKLRNSLFKIEFLIIQDRNI
jgi:hypothetical protein